MPKLRYLIFLTYSVIFLTRLAPPALANKAGLNIADHFYEIDASAAIVTNSGSSPGGWITLMPKIGDCPTVQDIFTQYQGQVNFIIRGHYPDTVPTSELAKAWAATLGSIQTDDIIYFYPWNEPNMSRECGGVGNALDPNDSACAPYVQAYVSELMNQLSAAGLLNTKVRVLSPMINQSAPNFTSFVHALGPSFFNQFYGITVNAYDFQECGSALCHGTDLMSAIGNHAALQTMGVDGKPIFAVETGVANPQGEVTDFPAFSDPVMYDLISKAWNSAWGGDSSFAMFSPLTYNPEIADRTPWVHSPEGQTAAFMRSISNASGTTPNSYDPATFLNWFSQQEDLEQCSSGSCGYASDPNLCSASSNSYPGSGLPPISPPDGTLGSCSSGETQPLTSRPAPCARCYPYVPKPISSCAGNFEATATLLYDTNEGNTCSGDQCKIEDFTCIPEQASFYSCCDAANPPNGEDCNPCTDCQNLPEHIQNLCATHPEMVDTEQILIGPRAWSGTFTLDATTVIEPFAGNDYNESRETYIADYIDGTLGYDQDITPPVGPITVNINGQDRTYSPQKYTDVNPADPRFNSYVGILPWFMPQTYLDERKRGMVHRVVQADYHTSYQPVNNISIRSWAGDTARLIQFFTLPGHPSRMPPQHPIVNSPQAWTAYQQAFDAWRRLDGGRWYRLWTYVPVASREDAPGELNPVVQQPAYLLQLSTAGASIGPANPSTSPQTTTTGSTSNLPTSPRHSLSEGGSSPPPADNHQPETGSSTNLASSTPLSPQSTPSPQSSYLLAQKQPLPNDQVTCFEDYYPNEPDYCNDGGLPCGDETICNGSNNLCVSPNCPDDLIGQQNTPGNCICPGEAPPPPPEPTATPTPAGPTPTPAPPGWVDCCYDPGDCPSDTYPSPDCVPIAPDECPQTSGRACIDTTPAGPYPPPEGGPCTDDIDCTDADPCTRDICNLNTNRCENPDIPGCVLAPTPTPVPWVQLQLPHLTRLYEAGKRARELLKPDEGEPAPTPTPLASLNPPQGSDLALSQSSSELYPKGPTLNAPSLSPQSCQTPSTVNQLATRNSQLATSPQLASLTSFSPHAGATTLSPQPSPSPAISYQTPNSPDASTLLSALAQSGYQPPIRYLAQGTGDGDNEPEVDPRFTSGGPDCIPFYIELFANGSPFYESGRHCLWSAHGKLNRECLTWTWERCCNSFTAEDFVGCPLGFDEARNAEGNLCSGIPDLNGLSTWEMGIGDSTDVHFSGSHPYDVWDIPKLWTPVTYDTMYPFPALANDETYTVQIFHDVSGSNAHGSCFNGSHCWNWLFQSTTSAALSCTAPPTGGWPLDDLPEYQGLDPDKDAAKLQLMCKCNYTGPIPIIPPPPYCGPTQLQSVPQCSGTIRTGPGDQLCGQATYEIGYDQETFWNANAQTPTSYCPFGETTNVPYPFPEEPRCATVAGCESCQCLPPASMICDRVDYYCSSGDGGCDSQGNPDKACRDSSAPLPPTCSTRCESHYCCGPGSTEATVPNDPDFYCAPKDPPASICCADGKTCAYPFRDPDDIPRNACREQPLPQIDFPATREIHVATRLPFLGSIWSHLVDSNRSLYKYVTPYGWYDFHDGEASGRIRYVAGANLTLNPSSGDFFFPHLGGIQDATVFVRDCLVNPNWNNGCATAQPPTPINPLGFSIGFSDINNPQIQSLLSQACVSGSSVAFLWDLIQPNQSSSYNWSATDTEVGQLTNQGLETWALINSTPSWAAFNQCQSQPGLCPARRSDDIIQAFREFITAVARRYPQITRFQFWNEANGYGWYQPGGDPQTYAFWLTQAYEALKAGNPSAQLAFTGMDIGNHEQFLQDAMAAGAQFDAVGLHPYDDSGINLDAIRTVHQASGGKPVWITEFGLYVGDCSGSHPRGCTSSESEKASKLADALTALDNLDYVEIINYLALHDFDDASWGLTDSSLNPRPAYQAFSNASCSH